MNDRELFLRIVWELYRMNLPYIYGGQSPLVGLDCSGGMVVPLRSVGIISYKDDYNSNGLLKLFAGRVTRESLPGNLVFYGLSGVASHVGAVIETGRHFISFAGGNSSTTSWRKARRQDARCHIYPLGYRRDLICLVNPFGD